MAVLLFDGRNGPGTAARYNTDDPMAQTVHRQYKEQAELLVSAKRHVRKLSDQVWHVALCKEMCFLPPGWLPPVPAQQLQTPSPCQCALPYVALLWQTCLNGIP